MRNLRVVTVLIASLAVGMRAQTAADQASANPSGAAAHGTSDPPPKWGIFAGYSSIETNNHNFHFSPDITISALDYDENGHGFEIGGVRNSDPVFWNRGSV
jgi:hypothetical protein